MEELFQASWACHYAGIDNNLSHPDSSCWRRMCKPDRNGLRQDMPKSLCNSKGKSEVKMVREDILGGLKNALERGEGLDNAKSSFISAGYPKNEVEEAASLLEKKETKKKMEIPTIYSVSMQAPTPSASASGPKTAEIKPFPQIKVTKKFNYWLIPPIIIVSFAIAYLIYNILLAQ